MYFEKRPFADVMLGLGHAETGLWLEMTRPCPAALLHPLFEAMRRWSPRTLHRLHPARGVSRRRGSAKKVQLIEHVVAPLRDERRLREGKLGVKRVALCVLDAEADQEVPLARML